MANLNRIVLIPGVMMGKPVVRGTRITVEHLLEELSEGLSVQELLEAHPGLVEEDVRAAIAFAVESVRDRRVAA